MCPPGPSLMLTALGLTFLVVVMKHPALLHPQAEIQAQVMDLVVSGQQDLEPELQWDPFQNHPEMRTLIRFECLLPPPSWSPVGVGRVWGCWGCGAPFRQIERNQNQHGADSEGLGAAWPFLVTHLCSGSLFLFGVFLTPPAHPSPLPSPYFHPFLPSEQQLHNRVQNQTENSGTLRKKKRKKKSVFSVPMG